MQDYSRITEIRISDLESETNRLLSEDWILLDICHYDRGPVFILGRLFSFKKFEDFGIEKIAGTI